MAVDTAEADAFRVSVAQDFDRVAIEDRDDRADEAGERGYGKAKRVKSPKTLALKAFKARALSF